jgi:hypothetical protein
MRDGVPVPKWHRSIPSKWGAEELAGCFEARSAGVLRGLRGCPAGPGKRWTQFASSGQYIFYFILLTFLLICISSLYILTNLLFILINLIILYI